MPATTLNATSLISHLQKQLAPSYTLVGEELLLVEEARTAIFSKAREQGFVERLRLVVDAKFQWKELLSACSNQGLFADKRLIDIQIPQRKGGREAAGVFEKVLALAAHHDLVLITLFQVDSDMRKSAWFKVLQNLTHMVALPAINRNHMGAWIIERLNRAHIKIPTGNEGQSCIELLVNRFQGNVLAAKQEIENLALIYAQQTLTLSLLEQSVLTVARYKPIQLSVVILNGRIDLLAPLLAGLQAEAEPAPLVLWWITEDIRLLLLCKLHMANGQSLTEAQRGLRIWGERQQLFAKVLPRLSVRELSQALRLAAECDAVLKGLAQPRLSNHDWSALQQLAIFMTRLCAP